ncbi:hypothetical protein B0H21DRAFT_706210 [Amylocystis lapponica]|nr:hypothetical protein B0H21DRAFT_706210 [Amylocystis lapponica]
MGCSDDVPAAILTRKLTPWAICYSINGHRVTSFGLCTADLPGEYLVLKFSTRPSATCDYHYLLYRLSEPSNPFKPVKRASKTLASLFTLASERTAVLSGLVGGGFYQALDFGAGPAPNAAIRMPQSGAWGRREPHSAVIVISFPSLIRHTVFVLVDSTEKLSDLFLFLLLTRTYEPWFGRVESRLRLNNHLQRNHMQQRFSEDVKPSGPRHQETWEAVYYNRVEYGRGRGLTKSDAIEAAAAQVLAVLMEQHPRAY